MPEQVFGAENEVHRGARGACSCIWDNSRRDQPLGPITRFDSLCGQDPEGMRRLGKDRGQSLQIQELVSDTSVRAMFQNGPQRALIGAESIASGKISRLGKAFQHRLYLPEVCTTNSGVVNLYWARNSPPRIPDRPPLRDRLGKWRKARKN